MKSSRNYVCIKSYVHMAWFALIAAIATGCAAGPKISADYDKSVDFSSYQTFSFYQPLGTDQAGYESLITQTIKAAVRQEMESRGYRHTESGATLQVNFNAKLAQQVRVSQTPAPMPYYGYRRGFYGGWGGYGYETQVDQYTEGTLNIDIIDAQRKQLIWEGVAVGRVSSNKTQEERKAAIRAAVAEIFAKYPFRARG